MTAIIHSAPLTNTSHSSVKILIRYKLDIVVFVIYLHKYEYVENKYSEKVSVENDDIPAGWEDATGNMKQGNIKCIDQYLKFISELEK